MNITIFFFSGTGNTWWCAERLAESFREAGHDAEAVSIEKLPPDGVKEAAARADLVGFGYPIYGSDLPAVMKDFILRQLPGLAPPGKDAFVFCTQLMFSGDGGRVFEKELAEKGYITRWSVHLDMPNNICVSLSPLPWTTDRKKIDRRLRKTKRRINAFTEAIDSGKSFSQGKGWFAAFLGNIQRKPFRRYFDRLRDDVSIDPEKCTLCNRCVNICPSGNLVREGDTIKTTGQCVLCVRCYNFCPTQAVLYMKRPHKTRRGTPYRGPVPGFKPENLR